MYEPNKAHILSIFPMRMDAERAHNGWVNYEHPAARKDQRITRTFNSEILSRVVGTPLSDAKMFSDVVTPCEPNAGYTVITVWDTFTWIRDFSQDKESYIQKPITAEEVATQLVHSWTGDAGHVRPGIKKIASATPTAEDLAELNDSQEIQFRNLINQAHTYFAQDKVVDISDLHRQAAKWMGAENLEWVPKIEQVRMKRCVACDESIRQNAKVCRFCSTNLVKFCVEGGIVPDNTVDPVVAAAVLEFKKKITKAA